MSKKALESFRGNLNYHICIMNSRQHIDYIYLKRTYSTRIHGARPLVRACALIAFPTSCHYVQSGYNRKINWPQQLFHRNIVNICCFNFIYIVLVSKENHNLSRVVYYLHYLVKKKYIVINFTQFIFSKIVMIYIL